MEYLPPIDKRTTEQLADIVKNKREWRQDVVEMAKAELIKRGVSPDVPKAKRKNKTKYPGKIESIKSTASYTTRQKLLMVLFGPILLCLFQDPFPFYAGKGFRKKNGQGIFYQILGFGLWGLSSYLYYAYFV